MEQTCSPSVRALGVDAIASRGRTIFRAASRSRCAWIESRPEAIPADSESIREIAAIRCSSHRNIRKIELGKLASESWRGLPAVRGVRAFGFERC